MTNLTHPDLPATALARTYNYVYAREGRLCILPKNLRQLADVIEGDVDEAVWPVTGFRGSGILNREVSTPDSDGRDVLLRVVDETVERTQMGIGARLDFDGEQTCVLLPDEIYFGLGALLVTHPEALMLMMMVVEEDAQFLSDYLLCRTSTPRVKQVFVLKVFYLDADSEVGDAAVHHYQFGRAFAGWYDRRLRGGHRIVKGEEISTLHAIHGLMDLCAAVAAASKTGKGDGFCRRVPSGIKDMTDNADLVIVAGITFDIFTIAFQEGVEDGGEALNVMSVCVSGNNLGHTANEGILIEVVHHLLVKECGHVSLQEHLCPIGSFHGVDILQKREGAQVEVFNSADGERNTVLEQALQAATCRDDIQPWHLLVEIAQQGNSLWHFLYLVDEQELAFAAIGDNMVTETQILPYCSDVICLPENHGICRHFEVHFDEGIEFACIFPDKRALAHLASTANDKGLVGGLASPLSHLMDKLSFVHRIKGVDYRRQRYRIFLK